jgi:Tfp pilus assembly protein PilF
MARRIASRTASRFSSFALATGLCVAARSAAAETTDAAASAQQLFDEARALMKEGNYAEACPKFAESQSLDPGGGTLLNLGICHYRENRTATAWAELRQALIQARRDGRTDRERTAQKYLDELYEARSDVFERVADPADCR